MCISLKPGITSIKVTNTHGSGTAKYLAAWGLLRVNCLDTTENNIIVKVHTNFNLKEAFSCKRNWQHNFVE